MGHSMWNQRKKKSPISDFVDILGVGWLYGETTLSEIWALSITISFYFMVDFKLWKFSKFCQ